MSKVLGLVLGLALLMLSFTPASAVIIFQDNFDRPDANAVGPGWTETENDADDVAISGNALRLRDFISSDPDALASQLGLSSTGLTNISLSYSWAALTPSDADDQLLVQWRVGNAGSWTPLASHGLGGDGSFANNSVNLGILANNLSLLQIRFATDLAANLNISNDEGARVDNFVLSGDAPVAATPEPATLLLLGSGLAGTGFYVRRKLRK